MAIHGGVRLFGDYSSFITKMENMFSSTFIPSFVVTITANIISPLELLFGILLILGFKTQESILILTLNMMVLISGVCLLQKWNLAGLQMSYVLYLFFLGNFISLNTLSIDGLINTKRGKNV